MRYDLDGELHAPTPPPVSWACPSCTRVTVESNDRRPLLAATCAGDPRTGRAHPAAAMVRTPARDDAVVITTPAPSNVIDLRRRRPRVLNLVDLEAIRLEDLRALNICPDCGPLVEVDNPIRREVRHRRGCSQEA